MRRAASSTAPTGPSASSPSRPSWSACSAGTCSTSGPARTGDCSAVPAAVCSANRSTAVSGTPPARPPPSARHWPPPRSPVACRPSPVRSSARRLVPVAQRQRRTRLRSLPGLANSTQVLHDTYLHCLDSQDDIVSQRIEDALEGGTRSSGSPQFVTTSGYAHRRHRPGPCPLSVREPARRPARSPRELGRQPSQHRALAPAYNSVSADQKASSGFARDS